MRLFTQKSKASYFRLCEIYERNISQYHPILSRGGYVLHFIVSRTHFTSDIDVKVFITIYDKSVWSQLKDDPIGFKQIIKDYSSYFVINDTHVVIPYKRIRRRSLSRLKTPPLKDRVSFEYYCDYEIL